MTEANIIDWGNAMRLARRAASLATEDSRKKGLIKTKDEASIIVLTDCPRTAAWFARSEDTAAVCGVSHVASVRVMIINPGDTIAPDTFEAERLEPNQPRVWARVNH